MLAEGIMLSSLRNFFSTGRTYDIAFRKAQLRSLAQALVHDSNAMVDALRADLGKSAEESWLTEIGFLQHEIAFVLKNLDRWVKGTRVQTPIFLHPGRSQIIPQPRGISLILSPWNYPFQLSLSPLIASIAAGNVAVIKPSEFSPACSQWLAKRLPQILAQDSIAVVEGGVRETTELLTQTFDFIFFTGSSQTAVKVAHQAAEHLTPMVLELGGKSPAVVVRCDHIETAARRLAFAKFLNAGQTCVAPDYVIVEKSLRDPLIAALKKSISAMYGPENAPQGMARIVNEKHFQRLEQTLGHGENIVYGGARQRDALILSPTLVEIEPNHPLMSEEIFGPILPIIVVEDRISAEEIVRRIAEKPAPLAAYLFSDAPKDADTFRQLRCGGFVLNDALMHLTNIALPFGGVGLSGYGQSHGYAGFQAFSHMRSELYRSPNRHLDFDLKYPPYTERAMKWLKWLFR